MEADPPDPWDPWAEPRVSGREGGRESQGKTFPNNNSKSSSVTKAFYACKVLHFNIFLNQVN